eukprot:gene9097-10778_t
MGTGVHSFMEVRTAWTWSLFGEDRGEGVTRQSDRVKHQRRLERKAALDNTGMLDVGDGETAAERQQRAKERQAAAAASGREAEQAAKGVIPGLESRAVTAAPLPDGPVMYDDVPSIMGTPETTWKSNGPQMLSGEFGPKGHLMTPLRAAGKKSERTAAGRLTAASRVSQIGQRINAAVTKLQQVNANQGDDHMAVDGETGFELVVASPTGQAVAEAAGSSREVATGRSAGTLRQMHHQLQGGFVAGEEASPEDGGTVGTGMWEDDPTPDMTVKEIQRSLPKALDAILPTDVAERVWATLLARAGYLRQPFAWVANPDASAKKQTYLDSYIDLYLQQQTQKFSSLEAELPELKLAAKSAVNQWEAAKLEAMAKLKLRVERDSTVADGNMSLRELQQKSATRLYQNTYLVIPARRASPLGHHPPATFYTPVPHTCVSDPS